MDVGNTAFLHSDMPWSNNFISLLLKYCLSNHYRADYLYISRLGRPSRPPACLSTSRRIPASIPSPLPIVPTSLTPFQTSVAVCVTSIMQIRTAHNSINTLKNTRHAAQCLGWSPATHTPRLTLTPSSLWSLHQTCPTHLNAMAPLSLQPQALQPLFVCPTPKSM